MLTYLPQAEERSLLAKLTLHDVYDHFQGDMFLSSIRESGAFLFIRK